MISDLTVGIITKKYKPYNPGERVAFSREEWCEAERQGCIRKATPEEMPAGLQEPTESAQPTARKRGGK